MGDYEYFECTRVCVCVCEGMRGRWGYQWTDCLQVTSGERKTDQIVMLLWGVMRGLMRLCVDYVSALDSRANAQHRTETGQEKYCVTARKNIDWFARRTSCLTPALFTVWYNGLGNFWVVDVCLMFFVFQARIGHSCLSSLSFFFNNVFTTGFVFDVCESVCECKEGSL